MILIFILMIFNVFTSSVSLTSEKQMILDVIRSYDKGTVVAIVCWETSEKIGFATKLMSAKNTRSIQFVKDLGTVKQGEDMLIVLDLNCPDSQIILQEADLNNIFEEPLKWLMLPKERSDSDNNMIPFELTNLNILVNTQVIVANTMENCEISLHLLYKIDKSSGFIAEMFGIWTASHGFNKSETMKTATAIRRKDLRGKIITMSVVITHESTKTEIYKFNNIMTDVYAKGSFHNIRPLYDFMNATQKLIFTGTWGYPVNNSWNGMVGQLQRNDADLCGTMILMTPERLGPLSYLTTSYYVMARFVFLAPPLSLQNNLFVLPFKTTVWTCIGVLVMVLMVMIYLNASWERAKGLTKGDDPTTLQPNISDVAMCIAGAITQQGYNAELKGGLGRGVIFTTLLTFLFLYTSYSANIVALLQSTSDQINTLTDLLNSKLDLGVEDQPYNRHYFTRATDRVRNAIYETKVARTGYKPNFMSIREGVEKIRNSETPFAFHMDLGIGYRLVNQIFLEHEKCSLREVQYLPNAKTWFCSRKDSPYREIYRLGLIRVSEHGLNDRVSSQMLARKPPCLSSSGSVASVNMVDFRPVLLCWLYGVIASLLILSVEILVDRKQRRLELITD